jgi:hypothetical protein
MRVRQGERVVPEGRRALRLALQEVLVDCGGLVELLLPERSLRSQPLGLEI